MVLCFPKQVSAHFPAQAQAPSHPSITSHPPESAAFSRRTPKADIQRINSVARSVVAFPLQRRLGGCLMNA